MDNPADAGAILSELSDQPEQVREVFIYAICQTMVEAGLLEFQGATSVEGVGTVLVYRNPDTDQVFEVVKPKLNPGEEDAMRSHIRELLEKQGQ